MFHCEVTAVPFPCGLSRATLTAMDWHKYSKPENWHRYANIFPVMSDEELNSLARDIKRNGLQEPIRLYNGKVLDGRNRAMACVKANRRLRFVEFHSNGVKPLAFVVAENLQRRHLSTSQRAAIAVEVLPKLEAEAEKRQHEAGEHGKKGGRGNKKKKPLVRKRTKGSGRATAKAGAMLAVSATSVSTARRIKEKNPKVFAAVKAGRTSLQAGYRLVSPKKDGKSLAERFVVPPFTLMDARKGYWDNAKTYWKVEGVTGGHDGQVNQSQKEKASEFDAVLAECVYRWFCPPKGRVLDPCAGEAVKGLVAAKLGHKYLGFDVRLDQIEINRGRAESLGLEAKWLECDSADPKLFSKCAVAKESYDLIFTSPPYYNTEMYGGKKGKDSSSFKDYQKFKKWHEEVFANAVEYLKPNRFLVMKIGEGRRDERGFFHNLVGDSIQCFLKLGLNFYNEAILATKPWSAQIRVENQFPNFRKLVSTHQTLLVFFKGDNDDVILDEFGLLADKEYGEVTDEE